MWSESLSCSVSKHFLTSLGLLWVWETFHFLLHITAQRSGVGCLVRHWSPGLVSQWPILGIVLVLTINTDYNKPLHLVRLPVDTSLLLLPQVSGSSTLLSGAFYIILYIYYMTFFDSNRCYLIAVLPIVDMSPLFYPVLVFYRDRGIGGSYLAEGGRISPVCPDVWR